MAPRKTIKTDAEVAEKIEAAEATAKKATKTVKKAAAETKAAAKKTVENAAEKVAAAKKPAAKAVQETYYEVNGEQICAEEIVAKVKEAYKAEGHTAASIKSLKTYINVAERKAYYVVNDNAESKYIEF